MECTSVSPKVSYFDFKAATLYRTVCSDLSDLSDVNYDVLVFFSPSGIKSLYQNFGDYLILTGQTRTSA